VQERFQNSTDEKDVGEGAEQIVRPAAAHIFRPLHALGCIVVSNAMRAFRSKRILFHFTYVFVVEFGTHFRNDALNYFTNATLPDPFMLNFRYSA
jgi:hypothetical protein